MKKIISVLLISALTAGLFCFSVGAISLSEGKDALINQFSYGEGPKTKGYTLDYRYYSPVKSTADKTLYPLVIWLHGHSHGQYDGYQIKSNDITNWASDEFQARFKKTGGAYILAVRAPENIGISWSEDLLEPLRNTINDFLLKHIDNINVSEIYLGGFSLGGMMTFRMAASYPYMFAAIFPVCPYIAITESDGINFADIPVWMTSGENDPLVSYSEKILNNWNVIVKTTRVPEDCRLSTLSKVCKPDGSAAPTEHYSWESVTNDMFSLSGDPYPHMTTATASGKAVALENNEGMISWLSGFSSDYEREDITVEDNDDGKISLISRIKGFIMAIYIFFRNLLRPLLG